VHSDPGDRRYRTLEVTWRERGVEMRMNIYFAADDTHWWATEVRVYDGSADGDWIGWGGGMSATFDDERAWPSDDHEIRLRAFGVPTDAEVLGLSGDEGGFTSVIYRDRRGRVHTIGCDKGTSGTLAGEPGTFEEAPAELCPPPPVDLGLFRSRRGETWTGDLDLVDGFGSANGDGPVTGELHIKRMRLSAFD
jgi:hypothetical protein